jgi:hypothetical protein
MLSLLFALPALAAAEVGPVEILSQRCQKTGEQVTCRVETSMDLGGAKYKLSLTGEAGSMNPILSLLPLAQENRLSVYFTVKGLRGGGDNLMEGRFEKIVIQPWND